MPRNLFAILILSMAPMLLAACDHRPTSGAVARDDGGLLYAAAGYALGTSMASSRPTQHTTIVNQTIYRPTVRPSYRSSFAGYRSTSFRSSGFGRR